MKQSTICFTFLFFFSFANASEKTYIASTPANATVKSFLNIPLADSIDFIRWKVVLSKDGYKLSCSYGLSKPNTNGFNNGGKTVEFSGRLEYNMNFYTLYHADKTLKLAALNEDILHITNEDKSLMKGTGGWSYTLNSTTNSGSDKISFAVNEITIKDSVGFEGRTPCAVPGIIPAGKQCYKLKWRIIFFGNSANAKNGNCKVYGTGYRNMNGRPCNWKLAKNEKGDVRYEILDENEKPFIWLREADKNILYFTDSAGKLLVGNEDFSYSLNRFF